MEACRLRPDRAYIDCAFDPAFAAPQTAACKQQPEARVRKDEIRCAYDVVTPVFQFRKENITTGVNCQLASLPIDCDRF